MRGSLRRAAAHDPEANEAAARAARAALPLRGRGLDGSLWAFVALAAAGTLALSLPLAYADEPATPAAPRDASADLAEVGGRDAGGSAAARFDELPPSARRVHMTGRLPFLDPSDPLDAELDIELALYPSPTGGSAVWRERQRVQVTASQVAVAWGEVVPLPMSAFTGTFRYVGLRFGDGPELLPRFPIESCVWASDPSERGYPSVPARVPPTPDAPRGVEAPRALVSAGAEVALEVRPREPATWLDAAVRAAREGRRLPTAEEWLAAHALGEAAGFADMTGHYEWVQPFVFSSQTHLRAVAAYQGKLNGCSEEELSPSLNRFPYRLAVDAKGASASTPTDAARE